MILRVDHSRQCLHNSKHGLTPAEPLHCRYLRSLPTVSPADGTDGTSLPTHMGTHRMAVQLGPQLMAGEPEASAAGEPEASAASTARLRPLPTARCTLEIRQAMHCSSWRRAAGGYPCEGVTQTPVESKVHIAATPTTMATMLPIASRPNEPTQQGSFERNMFTQHPNQNETMSSITKMNEKQSYKDTAPAA